MWVYWLVLLLKEEIVSGCIERSSSSTSSISLLVKKNLFYYVGFSACPCNICNFCHKSISKVLPKKAWPLQSTIDVLLVKEEEEGNYDCSIKVAKFLKTERIFSSLLAQKPWIIGGKGKKIYRWLAWMGLKGGKSSDIHWPHSVSPRDELSQIFVGI